MANGTVPATPVTPAAAAQEPPRPKEGYRSPRENLSFTDRVFLAIENPVLRRELLTALRSNKSFVLQFLYLAILGVIVYTAWPRGVTAIRGELARHLFHIFGQSQLVLLSIMSPAFSASAMTIEKERRCIDLLLTSPIPARTILMGKYMSSVVYLILLILSTAPIIGVVMWMPGTGYEEIASLYVILISVAASFGMIGLTCSVFFHRSQTSLTVTYMIVLPLAMILFVCANYIDSFFTPGGVLIPTAFLIILAVVLYRHCINRIRQPFDPVFKAMEEEDVATQTGLVLVRDRFPDNLLAPANANQLLPDRVNPMYQKEIRSEIFGRGTLFLRLIIQISMFLSVVFLTFLFLGMEYIFVDFLVIFTMLVAPAFACNTFTQERERGTLDLLLTTLIRPSQIVIGKFLSCLRLSIFLTGLVGVTLCFYLFINAGNDTFAARAMYLAIYFAILLLTIIFETSLAMFFSLLLTSTVRSMITTYAAVLILFAAPVAANQLLRVFTGRDLSEFTLFMATSPFQAVHSVVSGGARESGMVWPFYLGFCALFSLLAMAFVFTWFERRALRMSNTK
ncbi:MAG TPA: ABC transporter permease subunit [Planctomycetota bacterium]|nr:ABC transporter permease subunit [Planctomycetota bacterium]